MSVELPVDDVYLSMLERVEEENPDAKEVYARHIETAIHNDYQQAVGDGGD